MTIQRISKKNWLITSRKEFESQRDFRGIPCNPILEAAIDKIKEFKRRVINEGKIHMITSEKFEQGNDNPDHSKI